MFLYIYISTSIDIMLQYIFIRNAKFIFLFICFYIFMFLWLYLYTNVCISLLCIFVSFAIRLEEKEQTGNKESNRKDMERVKHFLSIVMQWGSVSSYRTHRGNKSFIFRQETVVRNRWGIASLQVAQNRPLQFLRIGCQCNKQINLRTAGIHQACWRCPRTESRNRKTYDA